MISFLKIATSVAQDYYPEMLGQMFLVNTTFFFKTIWSVIKPFIDEKTRQKIQVEKDDYLEKILEYIDKENLPTILGGECKCEEFGGCLYSDIGPWNPKGGNM